MKKELSSFELQMCDIQGRLFELARAKRAAFPEFAEAFMKSKTAEYLDYPYDRLQWAGEEYIFENLSDETEIKSCDNDEYSQEEVYWMGYVYRYWHFYTGEKSRQIYEQADAETMRECYLGFHTLDVSMAIDDLKELYRQKQETLK